MTFRGVNATRLKSLIIRGLSEDELRRFFAEKRKPLVMKGDRQNTPNSFEDAVQRVIRFTDGASRIFGDWLQETQTEEVAGFRDQLVNYFEAIDTCGLRLPEPECKKLFRCGLTELYAVSPSEAWLLAMQIPPGTRKPREVTKPVAVPPPAITVASVLSTTVASRYCEWAMGGLPANEIPEPLLRDAARVADAAKTGDRAALGDLTVADEVWSAVQDARSRELQKRVGLPERGFLTKVPPVISRDASFDYLSLEAVCVATRSASGGPYFLDVLCFLGKDGPFSLDNSDLCLVIPREGKVILHRDSGLPMPKIGVPETYHIEEFATNQPLKVKAIRNGSRIYQVRYIPFQLQQRDEVRECVKREIQLLHGKHAIFVSSDNKCIKPRGDIGARVLDPALEWSFDRWDALEGVELTQASYVIEPLPRVSGTYDCSPASVTARKYLRSLIERTQLKLTKQQITELAQLLGDEDVAATEDHRSRIAGNLQALSSTDVYYDELIDELFKSERVQQDIEERKRNELSESGEQLTKLRRQLESVKAEIKTKEEMLKKRTEQSEERVREVKLAVRKAFEQAKEKEAEVLGQLALWQELLTPVRRDAEAPPPRPLAADEPLPVQRYVAPQGEKVEDLLKSAGIEPARVAALVQGLSIAREIGLLVVIRGTGAIYLGPRIGVALAEKGACVVDVCVGLIKSEALESMLRVQPADVLVLNAANVSDLTMYARALLEEAVENVCRTVTSPSTRLSILVEAEGPTALSWPAEVSQLGQL